MNTSDSQYSLYCEYLPDFGKITDGFWYSCSLLSFSKQIYLKAELTLPDILSKPKQTVSFLSKKILVNRFYFGSSKFLIGKINECLASNVFRIWYQFILLGIIYTLALKNGWVLIFLLDEIIVSNNLIY